jgi:hypothetical protein
LMELLRLGNASSLRAVVASRAVVELAVWEPGRRGDGWWRRDAAKRENR